MKRDGLVWPKADEICFDSIKKDLPFLKKAIDLCEQKRTVIQAGGNAGMYPVELAKYFKKVLTFEPESINYYCLEANIANLKNVTAENVALGDENQPVKLAGWLPNCGAYEVCGDGTIPQKILDDLNIKDVDFIQLDVQGYEPRVLKGAINLLKRYEPVVMVEEGWGSSAAPLLRELGYVAHESSTNKGRVRDTIYTKPRTNSRGRKFSKADDTRAE